MYRVYGFPKSGYLFLRVPIRRLIEFMAQPAQLDSLVTSVTLLLRDLYLGVMGT